MTENLELREWIAVNVMRWQKQVVGALHEGVMFRRAGGYPMPLAGLPPYELTWNDAGRVVESMRGLGYVGRISTPDPERLYWTAGFGKMPANAGKFTFAVWHDGAGDTAPLAICLAAKAAIEGAL